MESVKTDITVIIFGDNVGHKESHQPQMDHLLGKKHYNVNTAYTCGYERGEQWGGIV